MNNYLTKGIALQTATSDGSGRLHSTYLKRDNIKNVKMSQTN